MFKELSATKDLSNYLKENIEELLLFSNRSYSDLRGEKDDIEHFILTQKIEIESLDFCMVENRAFLFFLFDMAGKFSIRSAMQVVWNLITSNGLPISSRLIAISLFYFNVSNTRLYIDRFDNICKNFQNSLVAEEDNRRRVLEDFANYYYTILTVSPISNTLLLDEFLLKVDQSKSIYEFLSDDFISQLILIRKGNKQKVHELKDVLCDRIPSSYTAKNVIMERGVYADYINRMDSISFSHLYKYSLHQVKGNQVLECRGVQPIQTEKDLFIYLKWYGKMHYAKMESALDVFPWEDVKGDIDVIDWGCGQGLASIALLSYLKKHDYKGRIRIILIEPSVLALKRAMLHVNAFYEGVDIVPVNKYVTDLSENDLVTEDNHIKIHLFSNILDIDSVNIKRIESLISFTQKNINYFICVSPYISDIKTVKINLFKDYFINRYKTRLIADYENSKEGEYWCCVNKYNRKMCFDHQKGCKNRWTRVIKVFKSDFAEEII